MSCDCFRFAADRISVDGPWLLGLTLALVNLLMMRKQLLVFKELAERDTLTAV